MAGYQAGWQQHGTRARFCPIFALAEKWFGAMVVGVPRLTPLAVPR